MAAPEDVIPLEPAEHSWSFLQRSWLPSSLLEALQRLRRPGEAAPPPASLSSLPASNSPLSKRSSTWTTQLHPLPRGSTPHPSCLMSKAHDSPTYLGSLPSCPSPTCVSRSPAMFLPEPTRLFHSVLSLQFLSPLTRGLHSPSSLVLTLHLACAQSQPHKWIAQDKHTLSLRRSQSAGRSGPWNTVTARGLWENPDVLA